jgi:hypothetical protein
MPGGLRNSVAFQQCESVQECVEVPSGVFRSKQRARPGEVSYGGMNPVACSSGCVVCWKAANGAFLKRTPSRCAKRAECGSSV